MQQQQKKIAKTAFSYLFPLCTINVMITFSSSCNSWLRSGPILYFIFPPCKREINFLILSMFTITLFSMKKRKKKKKDRKEEKEKK